MTVCDLQDGETCYRPSWRKRGQLEVTKINGKYYYKDCDKDLKGISNDSTVYKHDDFILNTTNKINKKGIIVSETFKDGKIVVTTSVGSFSVFSSEFEALEYIKDVLIDRPNIVFKMFQLYQEVIPKKIDLSELIHKVDTTEK